jgi:small subunit ribosomal protein S1
LDVSVGDNISGFIKRNDLARERSDQKTERFGVGDKIDAMVTNIDKKLRKVSLSIKAKEIEEEKKVMEEYGSSDSGASLGDILGAALAKKDEDSSS